MKGDTLFSFLVMLLFFGCNKSQSPESQTPDSHLETIQLNIESNNKSVECVPNQNIVLSLDVHADGGYQWTTSISDTMVVSLDSTKYKSKSDTLLVGGLTVETFYFHTLKAGKCRIDLNELRIWEKGIAPINTLQFNIVTK